MIFRRSTIPTAVLAVYHAVVYLLRGRPVLAPRAGAAGAASAGSPVRRHTPGTLAKRGPERPRPRGFPGG